MEAFALEVYRRFLNGQTVEQLSADLGIPMDRIEQRLRVAAQYQKLRREWLEEATARRADESLSRWGKGQL